MSLKDLVRQNPFQNLIVAGQSTADFPLRGHEDLLEHRFHEIGEAIENPDYPANAQHTIVFGEWGHGKTHFLRIIEHKINSGFPQRAKAVFFEPTESDPQDIFNELCQKLELFASDSREFIEKIKKTYPENLFLLVDETQAFVGEELSEDLESNLKKYWQLLFDLQQTASDKLYALHVFHCLSANTARAIYRVGQIPAIHQFNRYTFSLKSLDEEAQWYMLCDHIQKALKDVEIQPDALLNRGVSQCINELTGGNPRFVLSLMAKIYSRAQSQGLEKIDGSICYQTLCDTQRLDASGQNYLDRLSIKEVLEQLRDGQQFEQKIAEMFQQQIGFILGEWSGIDQIILAKYNLTTANIRRKCASLKEPIVLFYQPPGETHFRPSNDFLRLIQVTTQKTLTEVEDKNLLLRLQLEPEQLSPAMMTGIQKIMGHNGLPGRFREFQIDPPFRIYITSLGSTHLSQNIKVGFAVFKGKEIPLDVFEKIIAEIEANRCTIIIIIEDADISHDSSGSSYEAFKSNFSGDINVEKRLIFINGTDPEEQKFDEDFFVRLASIDIQPDEAKDWFDRLQINQRLKQIEEDCIYCPDLNERALLEELFKQTRYFKIGEIKSLNDNFNWVSRERLTKLELYLDKIGSNYAPRTIEQVRPFRFILGKLQEAEKGIAASAIEGQITAKYICTGSQAAIQAYVKWVLSLLVDQNKVGEEDGRFSFKDLDRELLQLGEDYTKALGRVDRIKSRYDSAQIEVPYLQVILDKQNRICQRIEEIMLNSTTEVKIKEHQDALNKLKESINQLDEIPEKAREILRNQFSETQKKFNAVKKRASWPFGEMPNPYDNIYHLGDYEGRLKQLEAQIKEEIPQQKRCRQDLQTINLKLDVFSKLLEGKIASGTYEGKELDECFFNIFNAIKKKRAGKIKLHFS